MATAKVEVLATSKQWEPQRAYEKKLGSTISKDKGGWLSLRFAPNIADSMLSLLAPKLKGRKAKASKSSALVTSDEEEESEIEDLMEEAQIMAPPLRPKPRRSAATVEEPELQTETEDEPDMDPEPTNTTPKVRPRPKATYKVSKSLSKSPVKASQLVVNGTSTPTIAGKRRRDEDEEQSGTDGDEPPTQSSLIPVRRKRVRH